MNNTQAELISRKGVITNARLPSWIYETVYTFAACTNGSENARTYYVTMEINQIFVSCIENHEIQTKVGR